MKLETKDSLLKIVEPSGLTRYAFRLPFFTAYLISKTKSARECLDMALLLRNNQDFRECREIFHNLMHLSKSDRYKEINGSLNYLKQSCDSLMKKYSVSTGNGLQFSLSLGLAGPSASIGGKLNQLLRAHKYRPFSKVFRNIAQEMLNVERLGALYEKLCSSIERHPEATYPKIAVTPKFMEQRDNEYGRPAEL